ncbi:MAG: CpaF family protein [Candidatus Omnitrophota bacterium]|nr:CpaF family protein [Candidatus Omnitrophota bacterium]
MIKKLKEKIRQKLLEQYSGIFYKEAIDKEEIAQLVKQLLNEIIHRERLIMPDSDQNKVIADLVDELTGFGPIENIMNDPDVSEIMINGPKKIYIEKKGKKALSDLVFDDEQQLRCLVHKILAPTRRRVDEVCPYAEVSLKDGSRVNIIIPPLSTDGIAVTIRKFSKEIKTLQDLIKLNTLDERIADFLSSCIKAKVNILFAGATGSGKTTTLNVLSGCISNDERIITIEDTTELRLNQEHVVRLEARPSNIEGKNEVTIGDLFKNSLRMRPTRIILGEIRGREALDMLQAMCSGHTGSLAVLHANSPSEVISRLETMILTSGLPVDLDIIYRQIAAAVHLIIQQEQLLDGSRKITRITQVNGLKDGHIVLEDLFIYEIEEVLSSEKVKGRFRATGIIPVFYSLFEKRGVKVSKNIFNEG